MIEPELRAYTCDFVTSLCRFRTKLMTSKVLQTDPMRNIRLLILNQNFWLFAHIKCEDFNFRSKPIVNHLNNLISMPNSSFEWVLCKNHFKFYVFELSAIEHGMVSVDLNLPSGQVPRFPSSVDSTVTKKQRPFNIFNKKPRVSQKIILANLPRNVPLSQFFDKGCIKPFDRILCKSFRMLKI